MISKIGKWGILLQNFRKLFHFHHKSSFAQMLKKYIPYVHNNFVNLFSFYNNVQNKGNNDIDILDSD